MSVTELRHNVPLRELGIVSRIDFRLGIVRLGLMQSKTMERAGIITAADSFSAYQMVGI